MDRVSIQIQKNGCMKVIVSLPRFKKSIHKFDGQHYWEIGKTDYPLDRITSNIKKKDLILNEHIEYLKILNIVFTLKKIDRE